MEKGLIKESTLTEIADAIRAKLESTETMTPGEVAGKIESISGGGPSYIDKVAEGTITLTSVSAAFTIDHGLGVMPNYFIMYIQGMDVAGTETDSFTWVKNNIGIRKYVLFDKYNNVLPRGNGYSLYIYNETVTSFTSSETPTITFNATKISVGSVSGLFNYVKGVPYKWIAMTRKIGG